jgi:hypothetical protein
LIHSYIKKIETAKETNWEQKFQKPQNENICLTNLNVENNGNFPILTFVECKPIKHSLLQILSKIIGISTAFALKSVKNGEKHHSNVIFIANKGILSNNICIFTPFYLKM